MLCDADKDHILRVLFKHTDKEECAVFLFGSFAGEAVYPSSDIDIGIVANKPLGHETLSKIKRDLEEVRTLRDIDVVDFLQCDDSAFLKEALREIALWHQTNKSKTYLDNLKKRCSD